MDLHACLDQPITLLPGGRTVIPTGIAIALPSADYVALVLARSGLGIKHGVVPSNCVGVIDSDYRGEIMVGLYNSGESEYTVQPADRIAQLMVVPVVQAQVQMVEELDETERGSRRVSAPPGSKISREEASSAHVRFFKKKSGEIPEEQERLQKAAPEAGGRRRQESGGAAGPGAEVPAGGADHSGRHRRQRLWRAAGCRRTAPGWPCWS